MKRIACVSALCLVAMLGLSACLKSTTKSTIAGDNTATLSIRNSIKTEALERMREMAGQAAEMGAEGADDEAGKGLDELMKLVDEKAATEELKKQGVEIVSSKGSEKDGWKSVEIEAKVPDVNAWVEKAAKAAEKKKSESAANDQNPFSQMGGGNSFSPKFYKTADPAVGQVVILPELSAEMESMGGMPDLDEMEDEMRDMVEAQMESMKSMFSVDEMNIEMTVSLPGKIKDVKGGKKVDDKTISFTMKGSDITLDGMKSMFGMKNGVSATFEIPEGCKIIFADPPSKTAAKPAEGEGEKEDEKAPKKGGLKIGD